MEEQRLSTTSCRAVMTMPWSSAKTQVPSICVIRETGAMKVYSMVPSQRSIVTVSVTLSKTTLT